MHHVDEARGPDHRVPAPVHGGGAGVVGHALHGDVPAHDADDALHHADVDAVGFHDRALLDVQLEEGGDGPWLAAGVREPVRVPAQAPQPFPDRVARGGLDVAFERQELSGEDAAARLAAFLVGEDGHFEGVAGAMAGFGEPGRGLQGGHRPDLAIEIAPSGH